MIASDFAQDQYQEAKPSLRRGRMIPCPLCGTEYALASNLEKHIDRDHREDGTEDDNKNRRKKRGGAGGLPKKRKRKSVEREDDPKKVKVDLAEEKNMEIDNVSNTNNTVENPELTAEGDKEDK